MPDNNIIAKSVDRDTAPCIGLGYTYLKNKRDDTIMIALPADHLVTDEDQYSPEEVLKMPLFINWLYRFLSESSNGRVFLANPEDS